MNEIIPKTLTVDPFSGTVVVRLPHKVGFKSPASAASQKGPNLGDKLKFIMMHSMFLFAQNSYS